MPQAQPLSVPADGLTTRQRRNRSLLMVHTGDGKGKSTAAFGLALRAWNQGWSVGVFQFVKSAKWRIGEQSALESLAAVHERTGAGGPIEWHKMGSGWSWTRRPGTETDHAAEAAEGWAEIKRRLAAEAHDLYVLDEFTYPMQWGWVDVDDVLTTITGRPGRQYVAMRVYPGRKDSVGVSLRAQSADATLKSPLTIDLRTFVESLLQHRIEAAVGEPGEEREDGERHQQLDQRECAAIARHRR